MNLRARLQRWWDRLLGRPPWYRDTSVTTGRTGRYADDAQRKDSAAPAPGELTLADDADAGKRRTHRTAGVDPYANDAGFAKPHGWNKSGDRD